jgi:hypothetical protein
MNSPKTFFEKYKKQIKYNNKDDEFSSELATTPLLELKSQITFTDIIDKDLSEKYQSNLISTFELFDLNSNELIKKIISTYLTKTKKRSLSYEDFIILFCSIIKYYSSLTISLSFLNTKDHVMLLFYGDEQVYDNLSRFFEYELQLKPFAYYYHKGINTEQKINWKEFAQETNITSPIYWPPHYHFIYKYESVYQKYDEFDNYNEDGKSKYRGIDKLRLIYYILDYLLRFTNLFHQKVIFSFIYRRNIQSIKDNISKEFIQPHVLNIFNKTITQKRIKFLRNYFGEEVSFYFLWLDYFCKSLIFPSIISLLLFIPGIFGNDISLLIYAFIITIWSSLFLKIWEQKEKIYNYIWGTDNSVRHDPINENFIADSKEELIFGYYNIRQKAMKHKIKKVVSVFVLLAMILSIFGITILLFNFKIYLQSKSTSEKYLQFVACLIGTLNGLQIKLMKYLYKKIAIKLNIWENHYKLKSKESSLALKLILFDFFNNYTSLFYIAFIKPNKEGCINKDCFTEIQTQIYLIFIVFFLFYFLEIMQPIFKSKQIESDLNLIKIQNKQNIIQGRETIIKLNRVSNMHGEYNDMIILFGFVCFFSVAAPLINVIVFLLVFIARLVDHFKFYHLVRVDFVNGSDGIGKYNKVIKIFIYLGAIFNVSIVLFSKGSNIQESLNTVFKNKWIIFGIIENILFTLILLVNWNITPSWFEQIDLLKNLYYKKYVFNEDELINLNFEEQNKKI